MRQTSAFKKGVELKTMQLSMAKGKSTQSTIEEDRVLSQTGKVRSREQILEYFNLW